MAYENARSSDILNRKDMVFAAINSLQILDKRSVRKQLNLDNGEDISDAVIGLAERLARYVQNGVEDDFAPAPPGEG